MKTISKAFTQMCTSLRCNLGFSRHKQLFVKCEGDVMFSFQLKLRNGGRICTVEFGVFPLCMPTPLYLEAGGYELDSFIVEQQYRYSGWLFDAKSETSIMTCIESIGDAMQEHLFPLFERCVDCEAAIQELIRMEELFDKNRKETLRLLGEVDCAIPWKERSLFDDRKYYMALKCCDHSYARNYLMYHIDHTRQLLSSFNRTDSPKQPASVIQEYAAELTYHLNHLAQIDSGNVAFFDELLRLNEARMISYISARYGVIVGQ